MDKRTEELRPWGEDVPLRGEGVPKNTGMIEHLIEFMDDDPKACAVSIGMDALRICIGQKPKRWSLRDVVRWMRLMAREGK